jgi:hypothetical protein
MDVSVGTGSPETRHGKTVSYAAAKRDSTAFFIEIMDEVQGIILSPLLELCSFFWVILSGKLRVEELKKLDSKAAAVVILLPDAFGPII